jgi:hypothetical protein
MSGETGKRKRPSKLGAFSLPVPPFHLACRPVPLFLWILETGPFVVKQIQLLEYKCLLYTWRIWLTITCNFFGKAALHRFGLSLSRVSTTGSTSLLSTKLTGMKSHVGPRRAKIVPLQLVECALCVDYVFYSRNPISSSSGTATTYCGATCSYPSK